MSATCDQRTETFSELAFHHCLARPGTIVDVGANIGAFSRPFSTWPNTRLIAFEPFAPIFDYLNSTIQEDHGGTLPSTTTLHRIALGEAPGTAALRVPRDATGLLVHPMSSMARSFEGLYGVTFVEVEVPVWTLDSLRLEDVTAIKIDAEGYETEVLHGARDTIQRCRPILSCECEERHREGATWYIPGFMRALGYDGWFHHQDQFWPLAAFDRATMQRAAPHGEAQPAPYINTFFFLPQEEAGLRQRLSRFGPFRTASRHKAP